MKLILWFLSFFFFQAEDGIRYLTVTGVQTCVLPKEEDGIRDLTVTGVQTCALPIFKDSLGWAHRMRGDLPQAVALLEEAGRLAPDVPILREHLADAYRAQIGRASCRERV